MFPGEVRGHPRPALVGRFRRRMTPHTEHPRPSATNTAVARPWSSSAAMKQAALAAETALVTSRRHADHTASSAASANARNSKVATTLPVPRPYGEDVGLAVWPLTPESDPANRQPGQENQITRPSVDAA